MKQQDIEIWLMANLNEGESKFFQEVFNNFKRNYNMGVTMKRVSWSKVFSDLIKAFKKGNPPDVFQLGTTWVNTFSHLGFLAEKPSFLDCSPLTEWMRRCCSYKGTDIAVPWNVEVKGLMVNKEVINKMGISLSRIKNREDFYSLILDLKQARKKNSEIPFPVVFPLKSTNSTLHLFSAWLLAAGGKYPELRNRPEKIIRRQDFMENFNSIIRLIEISSNSKEYDKHLKHPYTLYEEFSEENKYIFYLGTWEIRNDPGSWEENDFTFIPIPIASSNWRTRGGGSVLTVSSSCEHPELAWRLIEDIISDKYLEQWIDATGNVPAFKTKIWEKRKEEEMVSQLYEQILNSEEYPFHPSWSKIENILIEGVTRFLWYLVQNPDMRGKDFSNHPILQKIDRRIKRILDFSWDIPRE